MLSLQEVVTEHAQYAKSLHFLFKHYKKLRQGASFHRVTRLCYSKHMLHIADISQVDRTLLFTLIFVKIKLY